MLTSMPVLSAFCFGTWVCFRSEAVLSRDLTDSQLKSCWDFPLILDGRCAGGALDPKGKGEGEATFKRGLSKPGFLLVSHDSSGPLFRPTLQN